MADAAPTPIPLWDQLRTELGPDLGPIINRWLERLVREAYVDGYTDSLKGFKPKHAVIGVWPFDAQIKLERPAEKPAISSAKPEKKQDRPADQSPKAAAATSTGKAKETPVAGKASKAKKKRLGRGEAPQKILAALSKPRTVAQLMERTGILENTIRASLDKLAEAGTVVNKDKAGVWSKT